GHQTPCLYILPCLIHRRQPVLDREVREISSVRKEPGVLDQQKGSDPVPCHRLEGLVPLLPISAKSYARQLHSQPLRRWIGLSDKGIAQRISRRGRPRKV